MTQHYVFYAWQSDHPGETCRSFIRRALEEAARQLDEDPAVHDAPREVSIAVDADTQGTSGSPPVADTILAKIAKCHAFVPDLTPMPTAPGQRPTPNPNVLLEYGYALSNPGDARIVAVMNDAFGSPEDLPFDIRHRRWPIRYTLAADSSDADRKQAKATLVRALRAALGQVISATSGPLHAESPSTKSPQSRDLWAMPSYIRLQDGDRVHIPYGPSATIELAPAGSTPPSLSNAAMNAAAADLIPSGARKDGSLIGRVHGGVVRFLLEAVGPEVSTASAVTDDSRLHSVDFTSLRTEGADNKVVRVAAIEGLLSSTLANLLEVAERRLKLTPPLKAWVRLTGIADFKLAVDSVAFEQDTIGLFLKGQVAHQLLIMSFKDDPGQLLRPLFDELYDEAGGFTRPPNLETTSAPP